MPQRKRSSDKPRTTNIGSAPQHRYPVVEANALEKKKSRKTKGAGSSPAAEALSTRRYRALREPGSPEPEEGVSVVSRTRGQGKTVEGVFVVHQHAARQMHFDLRLEASGVLLSFAVPKGPTLDPQEKRLALRTEAHPLRYVDFEDVIPEGHYGAGAMIVWDRGKVRYLEGSAEEGLDVGKLDFVLTGYKLQGRFALIHTGARDGQENHWLWVKKEDTHVRMEKLHQSQPRSVLSGLTLEDLSRTEAFEANLLHEAAASGARRLHKPLRAATVTPMLCERVRGENGVQAKELTQMGWLYELKLDGVRLLTQKQGRQVRPFFRSSRSALAAFPDVAQAVERLPVSDALVDGELVVVAADGRPDFDALAARLQPSRGGARRLPRGTRLVYWIFDLLTLGPWDLRQVPLVERKAILKQLVPPRGPVAYLDHLLDDGTALFQWCTDHSLEGVVAKGQRSSYHHRRSAEWVKIKHEQEGDFVVIGWTKGTGHRQRLGALDLAAYRHGRLQRVGRVGSGLSETDVEALLSELERREQPEPVSAQGTLSPKARGQRHATPALVATIRYQSVGKNGHLRFPVFLRLRPDKTPQEAVLRSDEEDDGIYRATSPGTMAAHPADKGVSKGRITVRNLHKVFFPEDGLTKGDLCAYFERMAPTLLPLLSDHPVVLVRYPDGIDGKSFYQWRPPRGTPSFIRSAPIGENERKHAFVLDSVDALMFVANLGCIPLHMFSHGASRPDRCAFATLDLDLGSATLAQAILLARRLTEITAAIGLPSAVKTTGKTGLHVHVALGTDTRFDTAQMLTELLARTLLSEFPEDATMERRKAKRGDRILLDVGQVGPARTIVTPYSPRAVPGATVATPLRPEEILRDLRPQRFTIQTVPERVAADGDPMAGWLTGPVDVPAAIDALEPYLPSS